MDNDFPAFPVVARSDVFCTGMTLRDHFAGLAMQAVIAHPEGSAPNWDACARDAYLAADAMLKEREASNE